jgi:hypothetical protein
MERTTQINDHVQTFMASRTPNPFARALLTAEKPGIHTAHDVQGLQFWPVTLDQLVSPRCSQLLPPGKREKGRG